MSNDPHLRWGFSGNVGLFFANPQAFALGPEGRVGYQLNSVLGFYGSLGAVGGVGIGASASDTGVSGGLSAVSYWYGSASAEAVLADLFLVAAGLGIGKGAWASTSVSADQTSGSTEQVAAGGIMPQANARIGLAFGDRSRRNGKKDGFTLALDGRLLWAPNSVSQQISGGATGGGITQTVETSAVSVTPMLVFGYDVR